MNIEHAPISTAGGIANRILRVLFQADTFRGYLRSWSSICKDRSLRRIRLFSVGTAGILQVSSTKLTIRESEDPVARNCLIEIKPTSPAVQLLFPPSWYQLYFHSAFHAPRSSSSIDWTGRKTTEHRRCPYSRLNVVVNVYPHEILRDSQSSMPWYKTVHLSRCLSIDLNAFGIKNAAKHLGSFFDGIEQRTNDAQVHEQTTWYKTRLLYLEMLAYSVEWRGGDVQVGAHDILRQSRARCLTDLEDVRHKLIARLNNVRKRAGSSCTTQDGPTNSAVVCPPLTSTSRSPQRVSPHSAHGTALPKPARVCPSYTHAARSHHYVRAYQSCDSASSSVARQGGLKHGAEGALGVLVELLDIACGAAKLSSGKA
ncbi:hypothetical protein EVG20_g2568 [Dentipellis fragilis]|uniref:Uncharacterized protein n=1 Tax=Dentipellis fragilis TaxID=205917 RepID=A0A4Y9Z9H4_9AGAM|nr:hypothetical protein EVG20_g2568 [Dentipellis fragilis]